MSNNDYTLISTSALAKQLELPAKRVFELLVDKGWIERVNDHWKLTGKGQFEGGDYVNSKKYGEYIGWPESVLEHSIFSELFNRPLRAKILGNELNISPHRFNALLAELGWQKKYHRGWILTELGRSLGGKEDDDAESGVPFTLWPRSLLENHQLESVLSRIRINIVTNQTDTEPAENDQQSLNFETADTETNTGNALDGHVLQHAEDKILCNWLYLMNVTHAYRRELPDEDLGCCDFYLPTSQLHIESWHSVEDGKALSSKLARIEYYKKNKLAFVELSENDLKNLDTVFPKLLLKHGITVY